MGPTAGQGAFRNIKIERRERTTITIISMQKNMIMKQMTENARSLTVVTRRAMLDPTYNDPPDVGRRCGHFLICQVHVTRRPPHSPHFTRSDMPQRRMLQHDSLLCAEDIKICDPVLSATAPRVTCGMRRAPPSRPSRPLPHAVDHLSANPP